MTEENFDLNARISENLKRVNYRLQETAIRAGRKPEDIKLIAVSKTVGCDAVRAAIKAGQREFAENRVQVLSEKLEGLSGENVNWHLIGHLQTNKVKYCADKVCLIHSIDRLALAEELSRFAVKNDIDVHGLLQLNVSGEESKFGLAPTEIDEFLEGFSRLERVHIDGLMTMAPLDAEKPFLREIFAQTKKLSIDISQKNVHNVSMVELSMGMSGDFEEAILEGATMIRIGTAIFS